MTTDAAATIRDAFKAVTPKLETRCEHSQLLKLPDDKAQVTDVRLDGRINLEILWPRVKHMVPLKTPGFVNPYPNSIKYGIPDTRTMVEYFPDGLVRLWGYSKEDRDEVTRHVTNELLRSKCLVLEVQWTRHMAELRC